MGARKRVHRIEQYLGLSRKYVNATYTLRDELKKEDEELTEYYKASIETTMKLIEKLTILGDYLGLEYIEPETKPARYRKKK